MRFNDLMETVPWGRSFDEYCRMFALDAAAVEKHVLGCGDGPASFNAELTVRGGRIVSCDPLYVFEADAIRRRIEGVRQPMIDAAEAGRDRFVWNCIRSPEHMAELRMAAMDRFLADYAAGRRAGRYVPAALPALPFADGAFDLALCSHLLFLYTRQLSFAFHAAAVAELCRVAHEVRVFPLVDMEAEPSIHVEPLTDLLRERGGYHVELQHVDYEFQRGGNQMMIVWGPRSSASKREQD